MTNLKEQFSKKKEKKHSKKSNIYLTNKYLEILKNKDNPDGYVYLGESSVDQKLYNVLLDEYNKKIQLTQDNPKYYFNRGQCYVSLENYELALDDFNKAIQLNPHNFFYYSQRGSCYASLGNYELALENFNKAIELSTDNNDSIIYIAIGQVYTILKEYDKARNYIEKAFEYAVGNNLSLKHTYLHTVDLSEELDKKNKFLEEANEQLKLEIIEKEKAYYAAHEKEKEMLSFFTHTMRNALATAPESLRQAIKLLSNESYERGTNHYKAINKIVSLFSTLSLTDCLIDTFKQSIADTEEFKLAWQKDCSGEATLRWVIASSLRQSLNRIIFASGTSELKKLINSSEISLIEKTRKSFIEEILPLNIDNIGVSLLQEWVSLHLPCIELSINDVDKLFFGANQIRFSLLFSIISELILNALKYWSGENKIQISWQLLDFENYVFRIKNHCKSNVTSNLAGTHKGLAFIKRLIELLGTNAAFSYKAENGEFTAELILNKQLFEGKN